MPWIEGQPLHVAGWDLPDVQHAGRLLAALHALALPDVAVPDGVGSVDFYTQMLRGHLEVLARQAAIAHDEATALFDLATAHAPASDTATGIIHRDLCPENMVRQPSGALCVIDLESAATGASSYDLARTWYRWPMAPAHRAAFFTAYTDHGGGAPEWRHFPFWALCAVTVSAAERRVESPEIAFAPLRRLSALRRALRDGVDGEHLALQS
jgi:aminoglycoside phosphotransferase (APT) family kinase protein